MDNLNEEIDLMLEQSLFEEEISLMIEQSLSEGPSTLGSLSVKEFPRQRGTPTSTPDKDSETDEETGEETGEEEAREAGGTGETKLRPIARFKAERDARSAAERETWLDTSESLIKEDKLAPIIIDFNQLRKQELNESFLTMFGGWIKHILGAMFGNTSIPVSVRGSRREVESFARTLGSEKYYLESARRHGLDHPMTYKNKAKLDNAIKGFEKDTGLKWPFM